MEEELEKGKAKFEFIKTIKRFFLKLISLFLLGLFGWLAFVYFYTYSNGWRSGTLTKFSRKGYVSKTWEGEIYQRGMEQGSLNVVNKPWLFSVESKEKSAIAMLETNPGKEFRLHYKQRITTFFWLGDTEYFVDSVVLE